MDAAPAIKHRRAIMRILVIDDSPARFARLARWIPEQGSSVGAVRVLWARSGEEALRLLCQERGDALQGVLVDHDLDKDPEHPPARQVTWQALTLAILRAIGPRTPVLIHSMNPFPVHGMQWNLRARQLKRSSRSVEAIRFCELTRYDLQAWLEECRSVDDDPA